CSCCAFACNWNFRDGLENLGSNFVWAALGVWTTVFKVTLVAVVNEGMWYANRRATVSNTVGELVPRSRFVLAGQTHMVVWAVNIDVILKVLFELSHKRFEIFLAANFAHIFCGEVAVHARAVPVCVAKWLAVEFN